MRIPVPSLLACIGTAAVLSLGVANAHSQNPQQPPATDSAAQASPIRPAPAAPATDSAAQASPIGAAHAGVSIAPRTAIPVRLTSAIDSGHLKNGDIVHATLASPVPLTPRGSQPAGAPAELTVIETQPAGRIAAAGEFSLQLVRVGSVSVSTDTLIYRGQPGHKDLPDSAPAIGTDAGLPAGAELTFHVLPPPAPAAGPPQSNGSTPGSINGVAPGSAPPAPPPDTTKPAGSPVPR